MKLEMENWKEYPIESLFHIDRGKALTTENKAIYAGKVPCINGAAENNGVFCFLDRKIEEIGFVLHKAPALSMSRVGNAGKTFVQPKDFYVADNAFCLTLRESSSIYVYQFISTALNLEMFRYSYGRTIAIEKYRKMLIKLPARENGEPDYGWMECFIKSLHYKRIHTSVSRIEKEIHPSEWGEYALGELFRFEKGKRLVKADMIPGSVNYLGAIRENNGVREKIETDYFWEPNCITVNYNGSVGEAFYQAEPFWASDDVNVLYAKEFWTLNKYNALFIITVIKANRYRFSYGRKWTLEKMKETVLRLPRKEDGTPDFIYMEEYIRSLPYSDRI